MERRLPRPTARSFGSLLTGPRPIAVLAALLLVVNGPGATASIAPGVPLRQPGSAAIQADPVADLAWKLEYDVDKMFRYVADDIRYEPYPGILRGAAGTLAAGAGNSVDKALLLATLLDDSQIPVRFARGSLDVTTTARIVDALATDLAGAQQAALDPLERGLDQLAAAASPAPEPDGSPAADAQEAATIATQASQGFELARTRVHDTVTMLSDALGGAGITLPSGNGASLPAAEIADHTWVEVANGTSWKDLDPTLAAAQAGAVLTTPSEIIDRLPDDLRYGLRFDVLVERVQGDQLVTDSVLTDDEFADQVAGVPVMFGHATPSSLRRLGISLNTLLGEGWIDYRPTLEIGGRSLVADGSIAFPIPGGATDVFGSETSPGAGPVDGEATAEWLQVTVTPPGSDPEVARRTVFDRLPADVRHAGAPTVASVEPISLVDLDGTGAADYPPMRGVTAFAIATGPTSAVPVLTASDDGLGMFALAYHHLRDALGTDIALAEGARTFVNGPNIVSVSVDVDPNATAADIRGHVRVGLDIWLRSHGVLPLVGASMTAGTAEIVAGVTDHVAERFALEALADGRDGPPAEVGVGAVFEAAAAQGVPTIVLRGTVPEVLPYGPLATGSIDAAIAAGDVVVIPAKPVQLGGAERVGWWAVDPRTGATTDTMDDGTGAAMAEYETTVQTRLGAIKCYGALGATIAVELAWVVNVQLTHLRSLNTFSQLRHARQAGLCA